MERINPWVRADLENYNLDTLALIPPHLHEEYTRIMKELKAARGIVSLAIGRMYEFEELRRAFFAQFPTTPDNVVDLTEYREARNGA